MTFDVVAFAAQRDRQLLGLADRLRPLLADALRDPDLQGAVLAALADPFRALYEDEGGEDWQDAFALVRGDLEGAMQRTTPDSSPDRMATWLSTVLTNRATIEASSILTVKRWVTMRDEDVRDIHRPLDGVRRLRGETFPVGGFALHYPGQPVGPPEVWINCRCVVATLPFTNIADAFSLNEFAEHDLLFLENRRTPKVVPRGKRYTPKPSEGRIVKRRRATKDEEKVIARGDWLRVNQDGKKPGQPGYMERRSKVRPQNNAVEETTMADTDVMDEVEIEDVPDFGDEDEGPSDLTPWYGVLAPEGLPSGDGRSFDLGALTHRDLPLPLLWQPQNQQGHDGAVIVGQIRTIERGEDNLLRGSGVFAQTEEADKVVGLIAEGHLRGISVDVDDAEMAVTEDESVRFSKGRISAATIVPIPAFAEAFISLGTWEDFESLSAAVDAVFRSYDREERDKAAEKGQAMPESLAQVSDDVLHAYVLDASENGVAGQAEEATHFSGVVAVVDDKRRPRASGSGAGPAHLRRLAAYRALAVLGARKGVELGLTDAVLASKRSVSSAEPAVVTDADLRGALSRLGREAEAALRPTSPATDVEVRVGELLLADATRDRPLVVEGNTFDAHTADLTPFRNYTREQREKAAKRGAAMRDGSYPILDEEDLRNAIQAVGRAKDYEKAKRHIIKRARALDLEDLLPEEWAGDVEEFKRGAGWVTNPVETPRLHRYWTRGAGAAKIRWGTSGDFTRCTRQLRKYISPVYLMRTCAEWHHDALGYWPGELGKPGNPPDTPENRRRAARHANALEDCEGCEPQGVSLVASVAPTVLPAEHFADPGLTKPTGLTIDGDRVFGHLALWDTCHVGIDKVCVQPPTSKAQYAYFATGQVLTDDGYVPVGQITMDTGHAALSADVFGAKAHYDNTGLAVADIAVGEDVHGIWFSGHMRTDDPSTRARLLAHAPSGDWRGVRGNLELIAVLAVNSPGFPVPRFAAKQGVQTALQTGTNLVSGEVVTAAVDMKDLASAVVDEMHARVERQNRLDALKAFAEEDRRARALALKESV